MLLVAPFLAISSPSAGFIPDLHLLVYRQQRSLGACLFQGHQLHGAWITEFDGNQSPINTLQAWVEGRSISRCFWVEASPWFQIIPAGPFPTEALAAQFMHLYGPESAHPLHAGQLPASSAQVVYAFPEFIRQEANARFGQIQFSHAGQWLAPLTDTTGESLVAIVYPGSLMLSAFKDGQLQFARQFAFHHPIDVAYYLLETANCLNMDPENLELRWMGMVEEHSPLTKACRTYFRNQAFPTASNWQLPERANEIPGHYYYHLLTTASCALSVAV